MSPGTPAYMAPEQWRGQEAGTAADIFSWGILAWELLYGERPFRGGSRFALATAVTTGKRSPPPRGRRAPKWLRRVLERGLAPDPADRWPSMAALLAALERGRTRARLQIVAVVALTTAALVGLGLGLHRWDLARRDAACTAAGAEILTTWSDEARRQVRAAFTASGAADAAATADRVTPWLDERAAAWQRARADACMRADRGTWDPALTVPALWCLEDRQMELAALVAEFQRATPTTVQKAVTAATSLGTTDLCLDEGALRRLPVPPDSEREALRSLRADLTHARSLDLTGQYKPALELASKTRAAATAWAPLAAAAQAQESISRLRLGQYAGAEADGMGAYFTAANVGAWTVAAATATTLITVVGVQQARTSEAQVWSRHAEMAISQAGDPTGLLTAKRLSYLGLVQLGAGALAEAHDLMGRGLVLWEAALGPDHPDVAKSVGNLAIVASARGHHAEARALYARTLEIYERTLGPDHPDVAQVLGNVGHDHNDTGEYAAAIPLFERSLTIFERTLDPGHPNIATNLCNLATAHLMLGDPATARPRLERCLQIYERSLGPEHPQLVEALGGLTVVHTAAGELAEARALAARALEILERAHGTEHASVALALDNLAEVALASGADAEARALASRALAIVDRTPDRERTTELRTLRILADLALRSGQPAAALPLAERAVQTADALEGVPPDHHVVAFLLARSLVAVGGDAARALRLATAARDGLRAAGPLHATRLAEVERWLAEQPR
jgi:tetratricopeptide (TPR) repeat protein